MTELVEDSSLDDLFHLYILHYVSNRQYEKRIDPRRYQPLERRRILSGSILRRALLDPSKSPFRKVYNSGDDASFVSFTGLDFYAFVNRRSVFACESKEF